MNRFTQIELEKLPFPQIVETLSFEQTYLQRRADFLALSPDYNALMETDPAMILLQEAAYRELHCKQYLNDKIKGILLAYAIGSDLDQLGALFGEQRAILTLADPLATPPIAAVYEDDTKFRERIQLSMEKFTTAGSEASYVYWGMQADPEMVKGITAYSPAPEVIITPTGRQILQPSGVVYVTVLSTAGDGTPDEALLKKVEAAVSGEQVRPLTDLVIVQPAKIKRFQIQATIWFYEGPDPLVVKSYGEQRLQEYLSAHHQLGHDIPRSGIYAALHLTGVQRVDLAQPSQNLTIERTEAAYCDSIQINIGGIDE